MPTEAEAVLVVQALQSRGIAAQAEGALTSDFRTEVPGEVKVIVHQADLAEAIKILRAIRNR